MKFASVLCFVKIVCAWNLATFDDDGLNFITNNRDYEIVHVSLFYVRSFLTIRNRRNESSHQISIIESNWPENLLTVQSRIFPNDLSHSKSQSNCNGIVRAIQTAVDRSNGLLWMLDNGSKYCAPKLIVYDLLRGNNEVHRYIFNEFKSGSLKSIHLYEIPEDKKGVNPIVTTCALILLKNAKHLIHYSLLEHRPQKLHLIVPSKDGNYEALTAADIVMKSDAELMVTDQENGLWLANTYDITIHINEKDKRTDLSVDMKYLGSLLGNAVALAIPILPDTDVNHYLYYYLPRDGAIVRWNQRLPLKAEGHDVLHFSKTPIIQILFGAKGSVWIVNERADELGDHCERILNFMALNGPLFNFYNY